MWNLRGYHLRSGTKKIQVRYSFHCVWNSELPVNHTSSWHGTQLSIWPIYPYKHQYIYGFREGRHSSL